MPHKLIVFVVLWATITLNAQSSYTPNQDKISNSLSDYFMMNRENIHIHLNKSTYLTNEQIWFKGYIIEKKIKSPFYDTTNVYVSLMDENGQKIQTHLCYAENSIFEGHFKLDKTFKSGKYFLQVYTNYMNNFSEDESSIYEITVLNTEESSYSIDSAVNYNQIDISFFPESGSFIEGISNTIGIKAFDCNDNGIEIKNGEIFDTKGNLITNFSTNSFGYGKFEIKETELEQYKAVCIIQEKKIEKKLPLPTSIGITFSVDNYIVPNKTTIKVKTNTKSLGNLNQTPYTLVIQQNESASFIDFSMKDVATEQTFIIPNEKIFEGINTIHLVDSNLLKIGERIIYKPYTSASNIALTINEKRNDSIVISGTSRMPLANMSISITPAESVANQFEKSIISALQFDSYLTNTTKNIGYYLNDFSRKKQYELDNYLLTQKSKYEWNDILRTAPKEVFDFDRGVTVKGTINSELKDIENYKINMTALGLGVNEFTTLNSKNEFLFEHVIALDSTKLYFVILNKKGEKSPVKTYSQLLNNNRRFTKPFQYLDKKCPVSEGNIIPTKISFPKIQGAIALDSITIKARKNKLNNENQNRFSRGFKISDKDATTYRDVLQFINRNGFTVSTIGGNVSINGYSFGATSEADYQVGKIRKISLINGREVRGPAVYIDNTYIQDYNLLRDYTLNTIDEIYISKDHSDLATYKSKGIIKIYSKKTAKINSLLKDKSQALFVKNGFQNLSPFENVKYDGVKDTGFITYGTIDWKQNVFTDEQGNFRFSIPNLYQNKVKVTIEGITNEGQLISTVKIVDIP